MADTVFMSVQSERFHEDISRQIARRIVRGDLPPGSSLPAESVLIQQFGVSRAVVREALRSLAQRGLVVMRQGRRTMVLPEDEWDVLDPVVIEVFREEGKIRPLIKEFLWIRRLLEPDIAAEAAQHADGVLIADLSDCLKRMETHLNEPAAFFEQDMAFHNRLARATGNRVLVRIMATIGDLFNVSRDLTHEVATAPSGALEWHRKILEALEAGSPNRAREVMTGHLEWTTERILKALEEAKEL